MVKRQNFRIILIYDYQHAVDAALLESFFDRFY